MPTIASYVDSLHRPQVIGLWREAFGYDTPHNIPSLVIDRKLAVKDDLFFVALQGDTVVGTTMAGYDGHRGWLYSVAVLPAYRRQGIAAALVARAEQALGELGCVKINLQLLASNEATAAFYETLGYTVEPRVSMGKKLSQNMLPLDVD